MTQHTQIDLHTRQHSRQSNTFLTACAQWLGGLVFLIGFVLPAQASASPAGTVQLILGQQAHKLSGPGEQRTALQTDSTIFPGDRIQTGYATHVHLKMNDGAFISIRPQSELEVECYQTDPAKPLCMKFNLIAGEVRSVSGQGSKHDREKYRLNTPVAAIGVRGTDYTARVESQRTLVSVYEGAITASPFSANCQAEGLGNCHGIMSAILMASDPHMLEIFPGKKPQIIEKDPALADKSPNTALEKEGTETRVGDVLQILKDDPGLVEKYLALAGYDPGNDPQLPENLPSDADLAFGTWTASSKGIAQAYLQASEGREVTVGNADLALWRAPGEFRPMGGKVDYNLTESHAFIKNPVADIAAQVTEGQLSIDFDQQRLKTSLKILAETGHDLHFAHGHDLTRSDGLFAASGDTSRIAAGAISNDGQSVGYMIDIPIDQGQLNVQTLWNAK